MPTAIRADNVYSSEIDGMGVGLWAVSWQQAVDLVSVETSGLDDFLRLYSTYTPEAPVDVSVISMEGRQELEATP